MAMSTLLLATVLGHTVSLSFRPSIINQLTTTESGTLVSSARTIFAVQGIVCM